MAASFKDICTGLETGCMDENKGFGNEDSSRGVCTNEQNAFATGKILELFNDSSENKPPNLTSQIQGSCCQLLSDN